MKKLIEENEQEIVARQDFLRTVRVCMRKSGVEEVGNIELAITSVLEKIAGLKYRVDCEKHALAEQRRIGLLPDGLPWTTYHPVESVVLGTLGQEKTK